MKALNYREISLAASLTALSAVMQLLHLGYQSPQWGMWLDAVAVPWLIAFFLFGTRLALTVSFLGSLIITLFAPETWLGAVMKFTATVPLWLSLWLYLIFIKAQLLHYQRLSLLLIPVLIGLVFRSGLMLPLNYYWAIPLWTGMSTEQAMVLIPGYVIIGFNSIQAIIDVGLAWLLVFKFRLYRYASWTR
jgi:riboflavin transporter FmnP